MTKIKLLIVLLVITNASFSQKLYFAKENYSDSIALENNISALALQTILHYKEVDQKIYIDNLFRLQLVAKQYEESNNSLKKLAFQSLGDSITPNALGFAYKIYNATMLTKPSKNIFANTFDKPTELTISGRSV